MGRDKASLPFGPETMLARVVRLVGEAVEGPIVVVAAKDHAPPELPADVIITRDRRENRGPLEGLAAGLAAVGDRADAVYATACDAPLLAPGLVERLFELLGDQEIVVPKEGKFHHPLSAVYRTSVLLRVESLLAADRLRPFYLFAESDTCEVDVESLRDVDPELATLENVNCEEDYVSALRRAGFAREK